MSEWPLIANEKTSIIMRLQDLIADYCVNHENTVHILDAGCGCSAKLRYPPGAICAGIDISEQQLQKNEYIDIKIKGDIQNMTWNNHYDVVICWDVLEHLEHPEKAVINLLKWTKPNGLILISVPNISSIKGIITRFTPYWFHKIIYRYVYKSRRNPFPTYFKSFISPKSLFSFFKEYRIEYSAYLFGLLPKSHKLINNIFYKISRIWNLGALQFPQFYLVVRNTRGR